MFLWVSVHPGSKCVLQADFMIVAGGGAPERVEEGSADDWMTDGAVLLSPGVWSSEDPPSPPQEGSAPGEAAAPAAEGTGHDS